MATSMTKKAPISEDLAAQQISSKYLAELQISAQDLAARQLSSIVDAVPKHSLEPTKDNSPNILSQIEQLINAIKLLDEREEKLGKNLLLLPNSTKIDAKLVDSGWTLLERDKLCRLWNSKNFIKNKESNPNTKLKQVRMVMIYQKSNSRNLPSTLLLKIKTLITIEPSEQQHLVLILKKMLMEI